MNLGLPGRCCWVTFRVPQICFILKDKSLLSLQQVQVLNLAFEPARKIMVLITLATSEGSGEPAHPCTFARAFDVRPHEAWK